MSDLKAGLIGCGGLGKVHTKCLKEIDGISMTAYCDVIEDRAQMFLDEFGGRYATTEPQRLFRDDDIQAIYICTLHDTHAQFCIDALEAGKAIMVEKPLALTVEDCKRVTETVDRTKGLLMTAFKMRYYDMILKARELIPEPLMVVMQMMDNRWADDAWANDPIKGGGNVISQGCHSCDILRYVAGSEPVEVFAAGGNYYQATGVIDNVCAVFRFENGCAGSWVQGDASSPSLTSKFFMEIFAENRSATLDGRFTHLIYQERGKEPAVFEGTETGFLEENRAFLKALRDGSPAPIDHKDGLMATLMPLQAIASLQSGKPEAVLDIYEKSLHNT